MAADFDVIELAGADPDLRSKLSAYIRYQHAKEIRRTLTRQLGLFVVAVGILTLGFHFLPFAAFVVTVIGAVALMGRAGRYERAARRQLVADLNGLHRE